MDKYAQMKMVHRDRRLQYYMYTFVNVDPEKISVEDYFTAKNTC